MTDHPIPLPIRDLPPEAIGILVREGFNPNEIAAVCGVSVFVAAGLMAAACPVGSQAYGLDQ
jgi:hypothetical protein